MTREMQDDLICVMCQQKAVNKFADLALSGAQTKKWQRWVSLCKSLH